MKEINLLADQLNNDIKNAPNSAVDFFSEKGKAVYFPFKGILGQSAEAKGAKINGTIGTAFEEDGTPLSLECIEELMNIESESLLYAPSFGIQKLREIWKEKIIQKNPSIRGKNFSLPVVTSALTHGLYISGYLFVDQEDEIIIPDLYWDNYELIFQTGSNAKFARYPTFKDNDFNVGGLIEAIKNTNAKKKIILLNFPNNPTGYSLTTEKALLIKEKFFELAQNGEKLLVILDDAYFDLFYEPYTFTESLFSLLADLHENILAVKLDGPTKEDYVWSFRVGFISFAIKNATEKQLKAFEAKAAGAVRGTISNCSGLAQSMLIKAYQNPDYEKQKKEKFEILHKRYQKIREIFEIHPEYMENFTPMPFNSGYFMCVKPLNVHAEDVRKELLSRYSSGVIVLSGLLRIAFSSVPINKLEELFANINETIKKLKNK